VAVVAVAALPPMFNAVAVPVRFVATPDAGVPSAGVTSVGLVNVPPVPVIAPDNTRLVPVAAPIFGVTNTGEIRSAFVAMAVAILLNSVSWAVPVIIPFGSVGAKASFAAKLVVLV